VSAPDVEPELSPYEALEIDLTVYKAMLPVNRDNLDDVVEQHASIRMSIAERKVDAGRLKAEAAREKSRMFSQLCLTHRHSQHEDFTNPIDGTDAGPKPTNDTVARAVRADDQYIWACQSLINAEALHEEWVELLESWADRSFRVGDAVKMFCVREQAHYNEPQDR